MDPLLIRALLFISVLMIPAAAAEMLTNWTCNVTRLPEDLYKYQLSSPSRCKMQWEDISKTAYVHNLEFDPHWVHNVTREYLLLKSCQDYMHFTDDCLHHDAVEEVHCRVNCSLLSSLTVIEDLKSTSVNVTNNLTCIFGSWCPEPWIVGLAIGCLAVVLCVCVGLYIWKRLMCCKPEQFGRVVYISGTANEEIKV